VRSTAFLSALLLAAFPAFGQRSARAPEPGPDAALSVLVGRPTDQSAAISVLSDTDAQAYVEFGQAPSSLTRKTATLALRAGVPTEFELTGLKPNAACSYRLALQKSAAAPSTPQPERRFHTARPRGSPFTFCIQGDSHPERPGRMYDPDLYIRTLTNVASDAPDFYFTMGDDFSIERLFEQNTLSQPAVNAVYAHQRGFLGLVGNAAPLMLVNGNHEQAAKYLLDGTPDNGAVFAGKARTTFFPLPAPGPFYSGNAEPVEHVGLLRDYYAWEWGDALFVVIDPYWHSSVVVDNEAGAKAPKRPGGGEKPGNRDDGAARKGKGDRDLWQVTLGDAQYHWLEKTLRVSHAPFKFVFCHHVLGTGRGGIEVAPRYEWGGQDGGGGKRDRGQPAPPARGLDRFFQHRPTWDRPIHTLFRDTGVTIFFQGHDHLYARQELDGVTYQTCPNPADPTFTAFNREAYTSGDIFPNSGHLRVTLSGGPKPTCKVEYVRSARPADEAAQGKNASIIHTYTVTPRAPTTPAPPTPASITPPRAK